MRVGTRPTGDGKALFNIKSIGSSISKVLDEAAHDVQIDYLSTVGTFKKKPTFTISKGSSISSFFRGDTQRIIGYKDANYLRLDETGARPHIIRPKTKRFLVFQATYSRKTKPRTLGSFNGGASGKLIFAKEVRHPGFQPNYHTITIADKWAKWLPDRFDREVMNKLERGG